MSPPRRAQPSRQITVGTGFQTQSESAPSGPESNAQTRMALPLDTQGVTSFAVNAIVERIICVPINPAVFRKVSLRALAAFTEGTSCKSLRQKRKCHSAQTPSLVLRYGSFVDLSQETKTGPTN